MPRLFDHDHAYIFQNPDQRIIFAIPYESDFTLIGTTDVEYSGPIGEARIDASEIAYLCEQASRYFAQAVEPADVVWTYSGVRPLLDDESGDPAAVTRDYPLELDSARRAAAVGMGRQDHDLSPAGRRSGRPAGRTAGPAGTGWTADAPLPGGDLSAGSVAPGARHGLRPLRAGAAQRHPDTRPRLARRLARGYGASVSVLLADGLGAEIAPGLHEAELAYLHRHEWARTAEDVLWRRTKIGLHLTADERERVDQWCLAQWGVQRQPVPLDR